jgi:hypothetical protein
MTLIPAHTRSPLVPLVRVNNPVANGHQRIGFTQAVLILADLASARCVLIDQNKRTKELTFTPLAKDHPKGHLLIPENKGTARVLWVSAEDFRFLPVGPYEVARWEGKRFTIAYGAGR